MLHRNYRPSNSEECANAAPCWSGDAPPWLSSASHEVYVREQRVPDWVSGGRRLGLVHLYKKLAERRFVPTRRFREVALHVVRAGSLFIVEAVVTVLHFFPAFYEGNWCLRCQNICHHLPL